MQGGRESPSRVSYTCPFYVFCFAGRDSQEKIQQFFHQPFLEDSYGIEGINETPD